jgi:hypothetical protein
MSFDDDTKDAVRKIPDKDTLKLIAGFEKECKSYGDDYILDRFGVPFKHIFGYYQEPAIIEEVRGTVLSERIKRGEENKWLFSMFSKWSGEEKPYEPSFDINDTCDKREFILKMLKNVAQYDIKGGN